MEFATVLFRIRLRPRSNFTEHPLRLMRLSRKTRQRYRESHPLRDVVANSN
jgi:hypothetical protein